MDSNPTQRSRAGAVPRTLSILLAATLAGSVLLAGGATADVARTVPGSVLPSPRDEASALWVGGYGFTFGGRVGNTVTNEIARFNPGTGVVDVPVTLPTARRCTAAVYTGSIAYIIGGADAAGTNLRSIVSFNLATMSVATVANNQNLLPQGRNCPAAVWDGTSAYIFGGCCDSAGSNNNRILKFTPPSTVTTLALSNGPYNALAKCCNSAVWDPVQGKAYIFGGESGTESNQIVEWTKSTNTVAIKTPLPSPRIFTSSVYDAEQGVAYLFGGTAGGTYHNSILTYAPTINRLSTQAATLPTGRAMTGAAWTGAFAYVFGGTQGGGAGMTADIVRFNPGNSVPIARFTSAVNGLTVAFDASTSTDADFDPLTYTWQWGDGTADGTGVSASHTFPCIGPYSVKLIATDTAGASGSKTQSVAPTQADGPDMDGLPACAEAEQGTSDATKDADQDGITDYAESTHYPDRKVVYCPTAGAPDTSCEYPKPLEKDLYVELDWMTGRTLRAAERTDILNTWANAPMNANGGSADDIHFHLDTGNLGGGKAVPFDNLLTDAEWTAVYNANFAAARHASSAGASSPAMRRTVPATRSCIRSSPGERPPGLGRGS